MINIEVGMTIPKGYPYAGAIITAVKRNGWCRGYFESNVVKGDMEAATFSARAHWLVGIETKYSLDVG